MVLSFQERHCLTSDTDGAVLLCRYVAESEGFMSQQVKISVAADIAQELDDLAGEYISRHSTDQQKFDALVEKFGFDPDDFSEASLLDDDDEPFETFGAYIDAVQQTYDYELLVAAVKNKILRDALDQPNRLALLA
jgi:hypothetical protein